MPEVLANGVRLAYERYGSPDDPILVMNQGLGMPSTGWPAELIDRLVTEGLSILTFDNRDIGHSELLTDTGVPNLLIQILKKRFGLTINAPYQLADMTRDTEALLGSLNIESAHIVGVSMGGMIAQALAIHAPERVKSLTSIMSTTGNPDLPGPARAVSRHLVSRPHSAADEDVIQFGLKTWRLIGSPAYPRAESELREFLERNRERGVTAAGTARQMLAIMAAPSRVEQLRSLRIPSLVIHGDSDSLVPLACGLDTASALADRTLKVVPGMGHDLPRPLFPQFVSWIATHVRAVEKRTNSGGRSAGDPLASREPAQQAAGNRANQ